MKTSLIAFVVALAAGCVPACGGSSSPESDQPAGGSGGSAAGSGGGANGGSTGDGGTSGSGGSAGDGGDAGSATGGAGGTGGNTGCGSAACGPWEQCFNGQFCVSRLVPVTGAYSIDATEVTASQYQAWLGTSPAAPPPTPNNECSSKSGYNPGAGSGNDPVTDVDWCDAYAYCQGVGKRLCGKIGGGANADDDYKNASLSQWFNACSSGAVNEYAYAGGYDGQKCNGADKGVGATTPVASCPDCTSTQSGYVGVYDLSGNVWEWEDSCIATSGSANSCRLRGGSFSVHFGSDTGLVYLRCVSDHHTGRFVFGHNIGLRCCSP